MGEPGVGSLKPSKDISAMKKKKKEQVPLNLEDLLEAAHRAGTECGLKH